MGLDLLWRDVAPNVMPINIIHLDPMMTNSSERKVFHLKVFEVGYTILCLISKLAVITSNANKREAGVVFENHAAFVLLSKGNRFCVLYKLYSSSFPSRL